MVFGVTTLIFAWQNPTLPPPGGTLSAPLNTGSTVQTKTGALTIATSTYLATTGGNVGIGTTGPSEQLHIQGTEARILVNDTSGSSTGPQLVLAGAGPTGVRFIDGESGSATGLDLYYRTGADYLAVEDAETALMTILKTGNVGIGTTGPVGKLQVAGAALSISAIMQDTNDRPSVGITGNYPQLVLMSQVANSSHGPTIMLGSKNSADTAHKHWSIGTSGQDSTFLDIGYHGGTDINPHAGIRNYNGSTFMTILNSGNVGIGTTNPGYKLDVNGVISAAESVINGMRVLEKGGNNGTVSCNTFCQGSGWGGWAGSCVAAICSGGTGATCDTVCSSYSQAVRCLCMKL